MLKNSLKKSLFCCDKNTTFLNFMKKKLLKEQLHLI